ncbi:unnamed protein product, partial [Ectocarpus sp. 8 AP-2014]
EVPAGRVGVSRGARSVGGARGLQWIRWRGVARCINRGMDILCSTSPCVALCCARGGR